MKTKFQLFIILLSLSIMACFAKPSATVSGNLLSGYRVLAVQDNVENLKYTVYRGDYIKFQLSSHEQNIDVIFPSLEKSESITGIPENDPYFKMKASGNFPFTIDGKPGIIKVLDYVESSYTEISAIEARNFIQDREPFVLDVRSAREYAGGHLQDATLIPVQNIQNRLHELSDYKEKDIIIYCRSGNRSTVASKILVDAGYKRIYNLRSGMSGWTKAGYPTQK